MQSKISPWTEDVVIYSESVSYSDRHAQLHISTGAHLDAICISSVSATALRVCHNIHPVIRTLFPVREAQQVTLFDRDIFFMSLGGNGNQCRRYFRGYISCSPLGNMFEIYILDTHVKFWKCGEVWA